MIKRFRLKYGDRNYCRLYLPYKDAKNIPVIIIATDEQADCRAEGNASSARTG